MTDLSNAERPAGPSLADPVIEQAVMRFLSPKRLPPKPLPAGTTTREIAVPTPITLGGESQTTVAVHILGSGPPVLLAHGWQSQAADLAALARPLAAAGYTVWMPDFPAHGYSSGARLSIPLAAHTLMEIGRAAGPFAAAVAHSIGAACLVKALTLGLDAQRVVLLAPPTHYGYHARGFAQSAGFDAERTQLFLSRLDAVIGEPADGIDMRQHAALLRQPALIIHSQDDQITSARASGKVADTWPGARMHLTDGLGHFHILADAGVIHQVVTFAADR